MVAAVPLRSANPPTRFTSSDGIVVVEGGFFEDVSPYTDQAILDRARSEAREAGIDFSPDAQHRYRRRKDAEKAGPKRSLLPVNLERLLNATAERPRFAIEPHVPLCVVTMIGGHGGTGKTVLALVLAAHKAAGHRWAGLEMPLGRVLFVSLEDDGSRVLYRLLRIAEHYGLDVEALKANLVVLDGSNSEAALVTELAEFGVRRLVATATMEELREMASGFDLVIVDNASDAFDADENHRRMVRAFLRMLGQIARDNDAGVVLLAHIDKSAARYGAAGNTYSGSTAWHNSCRSRLALVECDGGLELRHEKSNFGPKAPTLRLAWAEHGVLIPLGEAPQADSADLEGDAVAVLAAIRAAAAQGVRVGAGRSGPGNTLATLSTFAALPKRLKGAGGRDAFWGAVGHLQATNRIEVREEWSGSRHQQRSLVEVGSSPRLSPTPPAREPAKPAKAVPGPSPLRQSPTTRETRETRDDYLDASEGT